MSDLHWPEAIRTVLRDEGPLHYVKIAERIEARGLRRALGATPAATVASTITTLMKSESSDFIRVSRGHYSIRNAGQLDNQQDEKITDDEASESAGAIQSFGVYWLRGEVDWVTKPKVLGQSSPKADAVDFGEQNGVYLLHDNHRTIYVGRATGGSLGQRLSAHTRGRISSRWNRFSWFGMKAVDDSTGKLVEPGHSWDEFAVINALEAILIETIEPSQNRRSGDGFSAAEFFQAEDQKRKRRRQQLLLQEALRELD